MTDAEKETLCARIDELCAEVERLKEREQNLVTLLRNDCDIEASWDGLRRFWSIDLTESGCLMRDRACKAETENAKLLRLLRALALCADDNADCDNCVMNGAVYSSVRQTFCNEMADELRAVGIEVDWKCILSFCKGHVSRMCLPRKSGTGQDLRIESSS